MQLFYLGSEDTKYPAVASIMRRGLHKKPAKKAPEPCPEKQKQRYHKKAKAGREYAKKAMERNRERIQEKYGHIYAEFEKRGGAIWLESIFGGGFDRERIYYDVGYLVEKLEEGIDREEYRLERRAEARREARGIVEEKSHWLEYDPQLNRQALVELGTSIWADMDKIREVYRERERITAETGIPHDVDHIVPIVNKRVCGLHNHFNLQILTATQNRQKSNKFPFELPD